MIMLDLLYHSFNHRHLHADEADAVEAEAAAAALEDITRVHGRGPQGNHYFFIPCVVLLNIVVHNLRLDH